MIGENERTVVVATTATAFEAETIAAALRERGIEARVIGVAGSMLWGVPVGTDAGVKVVVLESDLDRAKRELEAIRSEASAIEWDEKDMGDGEEAEKLLQYTRAKRWMWTLVIVLAPAGLFVISAGVMRGDPIVKTIGGVLLVTALVLAFRGVWEGQPPRGGSGGG